MHPKFEFELSESQEQRAARLHNETLIIDGLGGSIINRIAPEVDGLDRIGQYIVNGVNVSNETVTDVKATAREAMRSLFDYYSLHEVSEGRTQPIETVDDLLAAKEQGKLGLLYGFQSANPFEDDLSLIEIFKRLGLRIANLVYNDRNLLGDGCSEPANQGLTSYGRQVVLEMNRVGITLDLSHTGERTSLDALKVTRLPAVFSHSCVKKLTDHHRNITDEQIRAVASTGGLVGICPHSMFCETERGVRPTLNEFLNHIEYVAELVGIDHVAIGTDLFGGQTLNELVFRYQLGRMIPNAWGGYSIETKYVSGFDSVYGWINVTRGLVSRGFSDEDISKVLGGNWLRVFRETWPGI